MTIIKVAIFLCFFFTFIFSSSSKTKTATTGTIQWWCAQTPHYQTCNNYVAKNNTSTATISINQFLDMCIKASVKEARTTLKRAQKIYAKYPNAPGKNLWGSCVDYFDGVVYTLNMILDHTNKSTPGDVHTWLSATLSDITMCEEGFEMANIKNPLLPAISGNLTDLLLDSLAICVAIRGGNYSNDNSRGWLNGWEFSNSRS